ncbi:MAG TPA: c-type cytochrome biogenesis protein CcmI [Candidatus Marinimicrobia bacterium]|jgi:cytochrome c-type biogenesis protein CcmI|nr:c-type cytochrome biogenesis protein CcmI [Candidatus Neomarinimicrobiota bacterium]MDP7216860.1 c-type cytochrome biogenesis protein CcmI [Candidatus Neomarinimicrobiota bacterium]HJL73841.1 c-type cytochrome biogenesis protein CcmI [Candidatus Neomarinimicrobiota bacterium]HJM69877.1 c-type cytochrome biogenesis protein CcmI [Candidatus Neomarinimicrobiota bacterium]|tara:strand:- start:3877 stop:4143 length:267 start_codon:yes stop_codon:yes gene_type:complete
MISLVIAFLLFTVLAVFVIQPLFLRQNPEIVDTESNNAALKQRKKILYRQIKELEMDHQLGNIQDDDYRQARDDLKNEVSTILTVLNK